MGSAVYLEILALDSTAEAWFRRVRCHMTGSGQRYGSDEA
jgi:hypothetical protein